MMPAAVRNTFAIALLSCPLAGSGCGSAPRVHPISARPVVVAGPVGAADAAGFLIDLDLENPGDKDIPLERFDYAFEVPDVGRFEGRWAAFLTLPPKTTRRVTIPASMRLHADVAAEVDPSRDITWFMDGTIRYQAPGLFGQILFDAGIRRPAEPFSGSGTFRLERPARPEPTTAVHAGDAIPDSA